MGKFQTDNEHHPKLNDKCSGHIDRVKVQEPKEQVFDYKELLTGNLNLNDIVNEGGTLFFDCPPICYE